MGLAWVPPLLKSRAEMAARQALGGFGALYLAALQLMLKAP